MVAAEVYAEAIMGAEIQYYQDPQEFDLTATIETFVDQFVAWLAEPSRDGAPARRTTRTRRT